LLPPKKLSRLQLEEFSVIMPPKERGVATVMRPPSAISPVSKAPTTTAAPAVVAVKATTKTAAPATSPPASAKTPTKVADLPARSFAKVAANLPASAKAPTKAADLPSSITVLSPPISVETNLPRLPPINGTFKAEQPVVRIALPQSKKLKPSSGKASVDTMKVLEEEEGTPEPAPHQNPGEDKEEATPEPVPTRAREPKAFQAKGRHRGGYLPSSTTSVLKQRGGSASGARTGKTLMDKSEKEKESPAKKTEDAKGGDSSQGGRRASAGRKRKGRRNQGGRKRKKQNRKTFEGRKKAENVLKTGRQTEERDKKKRLKKGEEMPKELKDVKDPEVNKDVREEVRIHVSMRKMKNKVSLKSKQRNWSQKGNGRDGVRGDDGSLDLPEIPIFSSGPGRKGRKYEVGLKSGKELEDEEEEELPFYSLPRFSSLASLSRPPPQALLGLAGLAP